MMADPMLIRRKLARGAMWASIGITSVLLVGTLAFMHTESSWVEAKSMGPEDSFRFSTTGTEIMPLPVFEVLPALFPDQFQPGGPADGDMIQQFGFIRGQAGVNEGLPSGFFVSNHRPKSGSPS
ncbi:MAG: hypothetical protein ABI142_06695, partial [Bryocella sp.]